MNSNVSGVGVVAQLFHLVLKSQGSNLGEISAFGSDSSEMVSLKVQKMIPLLVCIETFILSLILSHLDDWFAS